MVRMFPATRSRSAGDGWTPSPQVLPKRLEQSSDSILNVKLNCPYKPRRLSAIPRRESVLFSSFQTINISPQSNLTTVIVWRDTNFVHIPRIVLSYDDTLQGRE